MTLSIPEIGPDVTLSPTKERHNTKCTVIKFPPFFWQVEDRKKDKQPTPKPNK